MDKSRCVTGFCYFHWLWINWIRRLKSSTASAKGKTLRSKNNWNNKKSFLALLHKAETQLSYVESISKLSQHGFWLGLTLVWDFPNAGLAMPTSHVSGLGHATAPDFRQKNSNFLCFSFVIYFDFISADEDLIAGDSNHPIRAAGAPSPILIKGQCSST